MSGTGSRVIAGDIGGTKTFLRCVEAGGGISAEQRFDNAHYATFDGVLSDFLPLCPGLVAAACFAVAGLVRASQAEVTNLRWTIDSSAIGKTFGIRHVSLVNDFYAVALGVPLLGHADLVSLQQGKRDLTAPMAILGAGTGLGEAIIINHRGEQVVIPTEGGHADFAPQDQDQMRLLTALRRTHDHVSWERVVSGMGLMNIYGFLTGRNEDPPRIAELAAGGDEHAIRTFRIFVDAYGAEAGNTALRVLARGGVFLAGGIAAKNVAFFTDGRFMEAFLRKGRFAGLLRDMPVDLIINEHVGVIGAAAMAKASVTAA